MQTIVKLRFKLSQLYKITHLSSDFIDKCIEHGIVEPIGNQPKEWLFDADQLNRLRKAARLRNDLDLNWSGLALAIDLIDELARLRHENKTIKSKLQQLLKAL